MKVITKGDLIAKFGERNGQIMWQQHLQRQSGLEISKNVSFNRNQEVGKGNHHPEKTVLIPPSEPKGDFIGRMQKVEEQFLSGERVLGDDICMSLPHNQDVTLGDVLRHHTKKEG